MFVIKHVVMVTSFSKVIVTERYPLTHSVVLAIWVAD